MVSTASLIFKYFPELSVAQKEQFIQLDQLYRSLNQKINVISRKDIDALYLHHVLHSLSIAKFIPFTDGTFVVDVGTGGGFPGIPLAILFPEVKFYMIDGRSKKISVVNEVIQALGLRNATARHQRSEELEGEFDFVLARAVTRLEKLIPLTMHLVSDNKQNAIPNGLITLKGGELSEEISEVKPSYYVEEKPISDYFDEGYYETKKIIYVQA